MNPIRQTSSGCGRLIIVCGLPGSGKTTHAKELEKRLNGIRFSADEWMHALSLDLYDAPQRDKVERLQWRFAQCLLPFGLTIIIEWGTWARSERDRLRLVARELGAAVELHFLSAPIDVLLARVQHRGMETPQVTRENLLQWHENFESPSEEEQALYDRNVNVSF